MKRILLLFTGLAMLTAIVFNSHNVAAFDPFQVLCPINSKATVCQESHNPKNPQSANGTNSIYGPGSIVAKVTSLIAFITGVASVILIILGGIKYAASSGDSNSANSARSTILYAVIGLVIAAAA